MGRRAGRAAAATVGGDATQVRAAYARRYREILRDHLAHRAAYYALEERWPHAPFWSRRGAIDCRPPAHDTPFTAHASPLR